MDDAAVRTGEPLDVCAKLEEFEIKLEHQEIKVEQD
jgi:hypothetical protein